MREEEIRKIRSRLRRLEGQLKGVETMIAGKSDATMVIVQMKAVIAAARGCLNEYAQSAVTAVDNEDTRQALLKLLLTNNS